jgi:hypothetical protein
MPLARPLGLAQIEAATRIHQGMRQWTTMDQALAELAVRCPGWGPLDSLLKVVAINTLYGTNVWAFSRMAEHVQGVMADADLRTTGPELVERIAAMPEDGGGEARRRHISFASKLAHFNLDPDRFPIYDSYAREMLRYHLGRENWTWDWGQPYQSFCTLYRRLGELAGLRVSNRALDRYLWLAGQRRHWRRNPDAPVSSEVRIAFRNLELAGDLERLGV